MMTLNDCRSRIREALAASVPGTADEALVDELAQHLHDVYRHALSSGRSEALARAAAEREVARVARDGAALRRARTDAFRAPDPPPARWRLVDDLRRDLKHAMAAMTASPTFTLVAVLTLALGIGLSTAMFAVMSAVLVRPLPYPAPTRLVMLEASTPTGAFGKELSYLDATDIAREAASNFDGVGIALIYSGIMTGAGEPERVQGYEVSAPFLDVLGVRPLYGRAFSADDATPGRSQVAVLGHGFWQRALGGDPSVVGRTVRLDDSPYLIVGVLPATFSFDLGRPVDVLVPATPAHPLARSRAIYTYQVVARLKTDATLASARAALDTIGARLRQAYPDTNANRRFTAVALLDEIVGDVRTPLRLLGGAVALTLLLVCANVTNLLLARALARRKEMAMRLALGAGRGRLARQVLTESLVLACAGGGAGLLLAAWLEGTVTRMPGVTIPRLGESPMALQLLAAGCGVALVAGLVVGLAPAFFAGRASLAEVLKDSHQRTTGRAGTLRAALVVVQTALALMLLAAAAALASSFLAVLRTPGGFDPANAITMRIPLSSARYPRRVDGAVFFDRLATALQALPGVRAVGVASGLPLSGSDTGSALSIEGRPVPVPDLPTVRWQVAAPGYFKAMAIPLVDGRDYTAADLRNPVHVSIVSESLARREFPGERAVGKRIYCGLPHPGMEWHEIIGVVGDVRHRSLETAAEPRVYDLLGQHSTGAASIVIRSADDPSRIVPAARAVVHRLDPELAVFDVRTLEEIGARSVAARRLLTALIAGFGLLALVVAGIGVYGVMAYTVARRTQEMGVRIALGAAPGDLVRLVLRQGVLLAASGAALGVCGTALVWPALAAQLYGAHAPQAVAVALGVILLVTTALVAAYIPARRATRVDPLVALRQG
jgi:putative ABC transport system permease protein